MPFDSGIPAYVHAQAVITVHFPIDAWGKRYIACEYCRYYSRSTNRCRLTDEPIAFPEKYVGGQCPLEEIKENT